MGVSRKFTVKNHCFHAFQRLMDTFKRNSTIFNLCLLHIQQTGYSCLKVFDYHTRIPVTFPAASYIKSGNNE